MTKIVKNYKVCEICGEILSLMTKIEELTKFLEKSGDWRKKCDYLLEIRLMSLRRCLSFVEKKIEVENSSWFFIVSWYKFQKMLKKYSKINYEILSKLWQIFEIIFHKSWISSWIQIIFILKKIW